MHILFIVDDIPFRTHGDKQVTAVNVVGYALIHELRQMGHTVTLQWIVRNLRPVGSVTPAEKRELSALKEEGVDVLPPLYLSSYPLRASSANSFTLLFRREERLKYFYGGVLAAADMEERARACKADAIFTLWSSLGIAATHGTAFPRVAYQGDIDFLPKEAQMRDARVFTGRSLLHPLRWSAALREWLRLRLFEAAHVDVMRSVESLAHVTASNVDYYRRNGCKRSVYVGNTWPDFLHKVPFPHNARKKIVGHIGHLGRTGSTYGLSFLLKEVLPRLRELMVDQPYDVHVIGDGDMAPGLRELRDQPNVVWRGFIEDLDAELVDCDAFCIFNNAGFYKAAYTRHIVAWASGLPLVVHRGSLDAIPEIIHGENALVACTADEAARNLRDVVMNQELNHRIRDAGRRTFLAHFTPAIVAGKIETELQWAIQKRQESRRGR